MYLSHLDDLRDPLVLGCIHTGNIFLEEDNCKLGGFENTLLGCPAKRYKIFENSVFKLDVIMFGKSKISYLTYNHQLYIFGYNLWFRSCHF